MTGLDVDRKNRGIPENEFFFNNFSENLHVFEGCGNVLGVVPLTIAGYDGTDISWKKDSKLRSILTEWGKKIGSDSVMVLFGDPKKINQQGYDVEMFVFEPNGNDGSGLGGGISTMCGNGIRAVAAWLKEGDPNKHTFHILSMSGDRVVREENDLYIVCMGELADSSSDLSKYVNAGEVTANKKSRYVDTPIPLDMLASLSKFTSSTKWSIGLNGTRSLDGTIDGEPHVVIEIPAHEVNSISELRELAVEAGPIITKNLEVFPQEINVNFIVIKGFDEESKFEIWNCTHERNLGNDADHSVTATCGTGSTVAGGFMIEKYNLGDGRTVVVKNTGGDLEISVDQGAKDKELLMKGPANRVK